MSGVFSDDFLREYPRRLEQRFPLIATTFHNHPYGNLDGFRKSARVHFCGCLSSDGCGKMSGVETVRCATIGREMPVGRAHAYAPGVGPTVVGQDANQGTPFMWLATHEPHFPLLLLLPLHFIIILMATVVRRNGTTMGRTNQRKNSYVVISVERQLGCARTLRRGYRSGNCLTLQRKRHHTV